MTVSAATTVLFHLFRQPVVLGYIVAGVIIGPHTAPFSFVTDLHSIQTLAELGVLLLLFSLGLEFDLGKLRRVGGVALLAGILEILLMIWLGYSAGRILGWREMDSLFLGALLSISSTTLIVQVLMETGQIKDLFAQIILGILLVEDIVAIIILVLLSGLANAGTITFLDVGWAVVRLCGFMVAALTLGYLLVPRLIAFVARFKRTEMLTVTGLGLAFGLAVLGAHFGFSIALGAFLMGAIVAESKAAHQIVQRIGPIREMFTAVFFVATGMLWDPQVLTELWGVVLFVTLLTMAGKMVGCSFGTFLAGYPGRVAVPVGIGMAQIGEFSFIIANLGRTTGVTGAALYPIAVIVSSVTAFLTPNLLRSVHKLTALLARCSPRPLLTFATFYTAWLSRLTDRTASSGKVQNMSWRLILYLAATVTSFVTTWSATRWVAQALPPVVGGQTELLQWGAAALVVLPFLFVIGRSLESLTQEVMAALLHRSAAGAARQSGLVRNALRFVFAWIAAIFVLAAGTPVLPPIVPLVLVVCGVLAATFFFWESLVGFHKQIETLLTSLGGPAPGAEMTAASEWQGRREVTRLLSDQYGPEVKTEDFVVPFHSTALNQTIQLLGLRTLTGVSIIAIYRDPDQILVPQTETVILPGDVLLLLGEKEQLDVALRYLTELATRTNIAAGSPPQATTATVSAGSPLTGCTLAEARFRDDLGVLVVAVRRGNDQLTNPGPDFRPQPGDILYLWGSPENIAEARRRAGSR
jgi:CPA2 family monovalent cation:H+ antiporter-2